ncbi:MAG: hypothetical protein E7184_00505 [Erysipelotrichaceae bacterium]|nr:hypothetical protein [Erysipelotrichaceae bacterium]
MKKILSLLTVTFLGVSGVKKQTSNEFSYKYEVIASSNSTSDVLQIYNVKESLINKYEQIAFNIDASYHKQAIIDNLDSFNVCKTCVAKYEDEKIVVYIGEGKGKKVTGDLRKNSCDSKPVRVQFFFSKYFD